MNPNQPLGADAHEPPEGWVRVGLYPTFRRADERALVLLATGFDSWLAQNEEGFGVFVSPDQERGAMQEVVAYDEEVAEHKEQPKSLPPPVVHSGAWSISLLLAALTICFAWQTTNDEIEQRYLNSTTAIIENNEWWRPFTALFLHADLAHLLGNLGGMTLFGTLLIRSVGPWIAYPAIFLSGALGNLVNLALYYPEHHRSLGASTAVFGALGVLAACGFMELIYSRSGLPWRRIVVPLLGGLVLLGLMGGGSPGSQTDVGAHIAGFLCGIGTGVLIKLASPSRSDTGHYMK